MKYIDVEIPKKIIRCYHLSRALDHCFLLVKTISETAVKKSDLKAKEKQVQAYLDSIGYEFRKATIELENENE